MLTARIREKVFYPSYIQFPLIFSLTIILCSCAHSSPNEKAEEPARDNSQSSRSIDDATLQKMKQRDLKKKGSAQGTTGKRGETVSLGERDPSLEKSVDQIQYERFVDAMQDAQRRHLEYHSKEAER